MDHLKTHANPTIDESSVQCRYCLQNISKEESLDKHLQVIHSIETKDATGSYNCITCWVNIL